MSALALSQGCSARLTGVASYAARVPARRKPRPVKLDIQEPGDDPVVVFRAVRTGDSSDVESLERGFRSKPARGKKPTPGSPEESTPFIYEGLSAFDTLEAATDHARELRDLGVPIGDFIAELHLRAGEGFKYALWGARGHLTMTGDPVKLRQAVVDIVPIEREA
jgi:hypothetical protein